MIEYDMEVKYVAEDGQSKEGIIRVKAMSPFHAKFAVMQAARKSGLKVSLNGLGVNIISIKEVAF